MEKHSVVHDDDDSLTFDRLTYLSEYKDYFQESAHGLDHKTFLMKELDYTLDILELNLIPRVWRAPPVITLCIKFQVTYLGSHSGSFCPTK